MAGETLLSEPTVTAAPPGPAGPRPPVLATRLPVTPTAGTVRAPGATGERAASPAAPVVSTEQPILPAGCASWQQAAGYAGKEACICGPVASASYASRSKGQPTFLNLGLPYPDPGRFTVVIWGEDRDRFPAAPEQLYVDQELCVTGTVQSYQGSLEIEVSSPAQIATR